MITIAGKHLVAGAWLDGPDSFYSDNPATDQKNSFAVFNATAELVDQAVRAATGAFESYAGTTLTERAAFLRCIAEEIEARGKELTEVAQLETALPAARLEMERGRTVNQLRFFADWVEDGSWLQARIDQAAPDRKPLPKPDIRVVNKAIGPVAVFGASNFPLAFSTAGGDTASALAAGCPVIVKAHPAHPGTCEIVAQAFAAAIGKCKMPAGTFSQLQGNGFEVGQALVAHDGIKAVGFTGSLTGGRTLFDIAVSRREPIPFYGELGSNNPVFLLPDALTQNAGGIAEAWAQSLTIGVGQFCTNPGLIVTLAGADSDLFKSVAVESLQSAAAQPMLTARIAASYRNSARSHADNSALACLLSASAEDNGFLATPSVFRVDAKTWLSSPELSEEIFGPGAIIVECASIEEMVEIARGLQGQLTATLHMQDGDRALAARLVGILEGKAGRVLVNGFPTGVEVCHAMVHGGPYPASTDTRSSSVGSLAIQRFLRPVSYQGLPDSLLPPALQDGNPLDIARLINGELTKRSI